METLPRLGAPLVSFLSRFERPTWSREADLPDGLLQQYASHLGPLTVLFERGRSVAIHLQYQAPMPHRVDLRAQIEALAAADGGVPRIFIDDGGWFVVSSSCTEEGLHCIERALTAVQRQAELAE